MDTEKEYKKSVDLWISQQEKNIDIIKCHIDYLKRDISLKQQQLKLNEDCLIHEVDFLNKYKKENE